MLYIDDIIPNFLMFRVLQPSVMKYLSLRGQRQTTTVKETHQKKLMKLTERQDRPPLGKQSEGSVKALDDNELPYWVQQVLALGSKHPVRDKFNETHFLADNDIFQSDLKNRKVPGEALCEIEAVAKAYAKRVEQTPSDKGVKKTRKYLKSNGLVAVRYDKGMFLPKKILAKYVPSAIRMSRTGQKLKNVNAV